MCKKHWSLLFSEGLRNIFDNCPLVPNRKQTNKDGDSFGDECDNCPSTTNSDQVNENGFYRVVQFQISRAPSLPSFLLPLPLLLPAYLYTFRLLFFNTTYLLPLPSITSFVPLFLPSTRASPSPPTPTLFQRPPLLPPPSAFYHLPSCPSSLSS